LIFRHAASFRYRLIFDCIAAAAAYLHTLLAPLFDVLMLLFAALSL